MALNSIKLGKNPPHDVNVIIEIPMRGEPIKYEIDKDSGILAVDRFMDTAMFYPVNYGYIPETLSEDGDPVDVLVLTQVPLINGCLIRVRPIAMLDMVDESGPDAKILAVPVSKLSKLYDAYQSYEDVSSNLRSSIQHFFEHYKDLESGKWVKIKGWRDGETAHAEILASSERYQKNKGA